MTDQTRTAKEEGFAGLEKQLQRFPGSVLEEFRRTWELMQESLSEADLLTWGTQGLEIATQPVRSWEAASEYFRASVKVQEYLTTIQMQDWAECGSALCRTSPSLAIAYFRASSRTTHYLKGKQLWGWADMGRALYKGTWKSSALCGRFFEATPLLIEMLSYSELENFAQLVTTLSHKSTELATESLRLGVEAFGKLEEESHSLIGLGIALAEGNWRDIKGVFEGMNRLVANVSREHQGRFLRLAERLTKSGMVNLPSFINESAVALGKTDGTGQGYLLELSESLPTTSPEAVGAFLRSSPGVLSRISIRQLRLWFDTGQRILSENLDGGLAYFKVESSTAEQALETLSSSVELERVQDILRMYCQALAGAEIEITGARDLVAKNIGWVSEGHASTEGTTVYLPTVVDTYSEKEMNFVLLKVVSTHQVAHIEFGSFGFSFDKPSIRFQSIRKEREKKSRESSTTKGMQPHQTSSKPTEPVTDGSIEKGSAETGYLTDMGRFFDLFKSRKLALDIFTAVEDGRLDHRVKLDYPGLAHMYRRVQIDSLAERPKIEGLPLQEAMVEFLVRLSLQQNRGLPCPELFQEDARAIAEVVKRLMDPFAIVEDSAEATIRIYDLIASLPNVELAEEDWGKIDLEDSALSEEELEKMISELSSNTKLQPSLNESEQAYESPPQVDYRGDFKPEMAQILTNLREQQGQQNSNEGKAELSKEMLEQLLASSAELELDAEAGQFDQELTAFAENMMKEAGVAPPEAPGQGYGPSSHDTEEGRALEAKGPLSFLYNEWDFRAMDYKPRWCVVREKPMAEGELQFYAETVANYSHMLTKIRRQFEMLLPEMFRKIKHLPDGEEFDLDSVIESIIDRRSGIQPTDKVYWRRNKVQRDVAVLFLMDMSASTAEAIDESSRSAEDWDAPDDPVQYMAWLRNRRGERAHRQSKRIIDLEKESAVLLINALETIGDIYGIYGFSGYGRENVEFYVIKDIEEGFSDIVKRRIDKITPLHATRMGPAIRHAAMKLECQQARTKLLFLISDGRPQDRGYSREGVEKEYAVHDTKMALIEARRKGITPFCLTVDKAGHDYLKTMCQDMGYEVLADISALPSRLPFLYHNLTA
ncbi:MAG: hypothetical protein BZY82_06850 [SAR202 cluster bacterium Io17-Chloro-G3]|nr:MAG: hypothetical protein BZY82_06850 [SAR202 cluster bacterium Io17-Chloro-G3]